jgi:hypothetical protein
MTCHAPPPVVDALTVGDFLNLIIGLDHVRDAMQKQPGR